MVLPRSEVVIDGVESGYHVVSRCVRRAFLCGEDAYSGRSYEHRKEWVRSRLEELARGFAIEICAYAVMSNHVHMVIRTRPDLPKTWTDEETAQRWLSIFPKRRDFEGAHKPPNIQEIKLLARDKEKMAAIRHRLSSVSWFMRCFNEYIARRANYEDGCKGRFWEGRFKCQALLDEAAYLSAMVYVDLNPVRAGIAQTPESSEFTSACDRIESRQAEKKLTELPPETIRKQTPDQGELIEMEKEKLGFSDWLCPINNENDRGPRGILPMDTDQYLNLLDWTGRLIKEGKRGVIPDHLAPIFKRLEIDANHWRMTVENYGSLFHRAVGRLESIKLSAQRLGKQWFQGIRASRQAFSPS